MRFEYASRIQAPVETVFAFHERPDALELLNPPGDGVRLLRRRGGLDVGARVEFEICLLGLFRIRWIALHTDCEPGRLFVDEQVYGPFRRWIHRHSFTPQDGGTLLADAVQFSLPGGLPVDLLFGPLVKLRLRSLFRYRHAVTRRECER